MRINYSLLLVLSTLLVTMFSSFSYANHNETDCNTCVLVIDMLNNYVDPNGKAYHENYHKIVPAINRVTESARNNGLPVLFMQIGFRRNQYKNDKLFNQFPTRLSEDLVSDHHGDQVYSGLTMNKSMDIIVHKTRFNSFFGTDLDLILQNFGCSKLIFTGIKTNNCIRATVQEAFDLGYDLYIPENSVATDNMNAHKVNLDDMVEAIGVTLLPDNTIIDMINNNKF